MIEPRREAGSDGLVDRGEGRVGTLRLGLLERDRGREPDHRIEQEDTVDSIRMRRDELEQEPPAEAVPDP